MKHSLQECEQIIIKLRSFRLKETGGINYTDTANSLLCDKHLPRESIKHVRCKYQVLNKEFRAEFIKPIENTS